MYPIDLFLLICSFSEALLEFLPFCEGWERASQLDTSCGADKEPLTCLMPDRSTGGSKQHQCLGSWELLRRERQTCFEIVNANYVPILAVFFLLLDERFVTSSTSIF